MEEWNNGMVGKENGFSIFHHSNFPFFFSAFSAGSSAAGERKVFVFHSLSSLSPETWNFRMNFRSI
jgi:hypothetical protein